jgi:hypothetical protein
MRTVIVSPALYLPSAVEELAVETVGTVLSTVIVMGVDENLLQYRQVPLT